MHRRGGKKWFDLVSRIIVPPILAKAIGNQPMQLEHGIFTGQQTRIVVIFEMSIVA